MDDLISVIVPIYKVEEYLDECISSIVAQTYKNLEIILVDDGSPDNCGAICDDWAEKDSRIRVIHKENGGLSDARNAGLSMANGDYIAFVDSDDWIDLRMYEKLLLAMKREDCDLVACNILSCYPERQVPYGCETYTVGGSEVFLSMLYDDTRFPVSAWNKLYRRELWDDIRFPIGKICEDAFTTYLLVDKANKIAQIPEALYCYRIRENSIMTSSFSRKRMDEEEAWRCNYEFMRQHYPRMYRPAFDFYLQKVSQLLYVIPKNQRTDYGKEYGMLHDTLKNNLGYIVFHSQLGMKQRFKLLLDYLKL